MERHYNKRAPQSDVTMSTLVDLVDMIEKPEGVHKINTKLFSISFPQLCCLQELALESTNFDYSSAEYRVIAIILAIANFRMFRPVKSDVNFAPALSNLNVSEYFSNPQTCQCKESKFCYEPHGHVITGDLRVIENAKMRELVGKGPKYREPNRVNWKATETMFLESIDLYAKNCSKRDKWNSNISLNGKTS